MQVTPGSALPHIRETAKPSFARSSATPQANESARPEKTLDQNNQKTTPPGLERALARLQSIPEPDRTSGQSNAIDRINRNIARYTENGAVSAPEAAPADPNTGKDSTPPDAPIATTA